MAGSPITVTALALTPVKGLRLQSRDEVQIGAGQPRPILVFGQVRNDAELGSIWYVGGAYGCLASAQVRAVCGI